ncbi:ABC1 kinase family protein [Nitrincola sp.]|uniref:ABC1 kinase family protein n=1 Tax=Nitrincola sp. TaxID=1926584 RepID=UPI003A95703F
MTKTHQRAVPAGRISRMAHMGGLATRLAGGMLAEGARQMASGKRPSSRDLLMTPANVRRVADKLSHLRGAAMKIGQLLSMDAGDLLPPELSELLSVLRAGANPMPMLQLATIMETSMGEDWQSHFSQFGFTPVAAASIGQVHKALDHQGQALALKIQYPGIRQSIDSDVDNVITLLKMSRLLPAGVIADELIDEAKAQLHAEADYHLEAQHLQAYKALLADDPSFRVPQCYTELCSENLLVMSFEQGVAVESLTAYSLAERNRCAGLLLQLLFRELFEFGRVQTDPNFANFLYDPDNGQLVLLDFGATRLYSPALVMAYRQLFHAGLNQDRQQLLEAATQIGYFSEQVTASQQQAVLALFELALEPLRSDRYDFAATDLARRIKDQGMALSMREGYWHSPPVDALFLHRKLAGLYLLFARLGVSLACRDILRPWLTN